MINIKLIWYAILIVILAGCDAGYKIQNDKVLYISYNESNGRNTRNFGADPETFQILENDRYGLDKKNVYYEGNPIDDADPRSFKVLSDYISKDRNRGYTGTIAIPGSDGNTFESVMNDYTRDKNDVYRAEYPLHSSSPKTFEVIEKGYGYWSRDENNYYFAERKVPVKDYNTFEILDDDCFFAKDRFQVYREDKVLLGVDAKTFVFLEVCVGRDKFGCHDGEKRCGCPTK